MTLEDFHNLEFGEDSNISDSHYSETASNIETTEDQPIIIKEEEEEPVKEQQDIDFQEQLIVQTDTEEELNISDQESSSEEEINPESEETTEESKNEEMANLDDVLNGLNALTVALTVGLRTEKNHIPI